MMTFMRTAEQEAVLRSVRKLVDFWQIEADELVLDQADRFCAPPAAVEAVPKYRHPRTGDTWDGEGSQPQWLRHALTKEGYTVEELRAGAMAPGAQQLASPTGIEPVSAP